MTPAREQDSPGDFPDGTRCRSRRDPGSSDRECLPIMVKEHLTSCTQNFSRTNNKNPPTDKIKSEFIHRTRCSRRVIAESRPFLNRISSQLIHLEMQTPRPVAALPVSTARRFESNTFQGQVEICFHSGRNSECAASNLAAKTPRPRQQSRPRS
jgi:hypothetical protein